MAAKTDLDDNYSKMLHRLHVRLLQDGRSPLLEKGIPKREIAYNPVSGVVHEGVNGILLDYVSAHKGYEDPRWLKMGEISNIGYKVIRGEKPVAVAYNNRYNHMTDGKVQGNSYYYVYNAEQIKNFPERVISKEQKNNQKIEKERKFGYLSENTKGEPSKVWSRMKSMVNDSSAHMKETALTIAVYRFCQETRLPYNPAVAKDLVKKTMESVKDEKKILTSIYHGNVQKNRILRKDMQLETGKIRTPIISLGQKESLQSNSKNNGHELGR